jgi:hypothetical protein
MHEHSHPPTRSTSGKLLYQGACRSVFLTPLQRLSQARLSSQDLNGAVPLGASTLKLPSPRDSLSPLWLR